MKTAIKIILMLLLASTSVLGETIAEGPFSGVDLSSLSIESSQTIKQANEDFILVLNGSMPLYAKFDEKAHLPSDGGTSFYKENNYSLIVVKSISTFGNLNGYIYGPIIKFKKEFAPGHSDSVQSLRFYSFEQMKEIIKR